jgi:hypothetical protein
MEEKSLISQSEVLGKESLLGKVLLDDKEISVCYEFIKFRIYISD